MSAQIRPEDLARLDRAAQRRGIVRDVMVADAIDAFLTREMWSGGFTPAPPMEEPAPSPSLGGRSRRLHQR